MSAWGYSIAAWLWMFITIVAAQVTVNLNDSSVYFSTASSGDVQHYYFSAQQANSLIPVDSSQQLYLTLTSCSQPIPPANYDGDFPTLALFLSTSADNTLPGPTQGEEVFNNATPGRISWQSSSATEVWIGVVAPALSQAWTGNWTYQIAISTQGWVHPMLNPDKASFMLDDTDQEHALFLTSVASPDQNNMTMIITYGQPSQLIYSLCAATHYQVTNVTTNSSDTVRGQPGWVNHQILVSNLTQNTTYVAYLLQSTTNQPQSISAPITLYTKSQANCRLVYGLAFCSNVAYSVPANPDSAYDISDLATNYDNNSQNLFSPFDKALSQFNCNSTMYSLVRNCTDCYNDYKRWLCSVTIPRCTTPANFTDDTSLLPAMHSISVNSSRNPWIDSTIGPGGWTELLPCIDLCYQTVQSCPPFLQFTCPTNDMVAMQYGYWQSGTPDSVGFDVNNPSCNRVDLDPSLLVISGAFVIIPSWKLTLATTTLVYTFLNI